MPPVEHVSRARTRAYPCGGSEARVARIFYSMAGEGRGHAARVRAVTEHLRRSHEVSLFCPGDAHDFLAPLYAGSEVRVERIPGLRFAYRGDSVDYARTAARACGYVAGLGRLVRRLTSRMRRERPDLVVTDFEPALPRAARRAGVPFVSLSHQHFLVANDLRELPLRARLWARMAGLVVGAYHRGQRATVVSSFYAPPLRPGCRATFQVGVMLRPELRDARPVDGEHLLAYVRRSLPSRVLDVLAACGREVRVYGLGAGPPRGGLRFAEVDERGFLADLASCGAVVSTAGNQLVGEALALRKPVLAIPEPGNVEQRINGHFLARSGAGRALEASRLDAAALDAFLGELPSLRAAAARGSWDGTDRALAILGAHLSQADGRGAARSRTDLEACAPSTS